MKDEKKRKIRIRFEKSLCWVFIPNYLRLKTNDTVLAKIFSKFTINKNAF